MHVPQIEWRVLAGYLVFLGSYTVFAFGRFPGLKVDRAGAAIIGAVLMFAFRILAAGDALRYVDFATIVLLFSMMLIVGNLRLAGFFERVAAAVVERIGKHHLLPAVLFSTGLLSAFFVNDIVCLVMVPFVLTLTRRFGVPPMRYLLAVALASNLGSVATITGNPQNMLIGSASGISYINFLAHLGPIAVFGLFVGWAVLHFAGRDEQSVSPGNAEPAQNPKRRESDHAVPSLTKPVLVSLGILTAFLAGAPPALVAAVGASVLLFSRRLEPRLMFDEVDWDLLVFFIGLFLIVGGAEQVGMMSLLFDAAKALNLQRLAVLTLVTAALSNVVSNVPAVMLLKSVIPTMPDPKHAWLTLAMASTLAGNLTIAGSVANIIVVERARPEVHIGFWDHFRVGFPVTIITLVAGWAWLSWIP
jgi:Na+/H+ antiporter NhaD/arsenite permease-like protein